MGEGQKRSVVINVYEDETKENFVDAVPIIDLGIVSGGRTEPSSLRSLVHIVKTMLRAQGRATDEDLERYHYEMAD